MFINNRDIEFKSPGPTDRQMIQCSVYVKNELPGVITALLKCATAAVTERGRVYRSIHCNRLSGSLGLCLPLCASRPMCSVIMLFVSVRPGLVLSSRNLQPENHRRTDNLHSQHRDFTSVPPADYTPLCRSNDALKFC